LHNLKNMHNNH